MHHSVTESKWPGSLPSPLQEQKERNHEEGGVGRGIDSINKKKGQIIEKCEKEMVSEFGM